MVSARDPPQSRRFPQAESRVGGKYSTQMEMKKSEGRNPYILQNRFQNEGHQK